MKVVILLAIAALQGCISVVTLDDGKEYYKVEVPQEAIRPMTVADNMVAALLLVAVLSGKNPDCFNNEEIRTRKCTRERESEIKRCRRGGRHCEWIRDLL